MSYGKITIILPTKNHENEIVENIATLKSFLKDKYSDFQILIMSNGSTPQNKKMLKRLKYDERHTEIHYLNKTGKGNAIKEGIGLSKYNHVVIFDSDFSYNIELLDKFYKNSLPKASFIYAKRKISQDLFQNTKISRLVAGYFFNTILRIFLKIHSRDTQAGFKFIDKSIFTNCSDFISEDYMYDVELFILARKLGITPHPVEVININPVENSNIKLINDSLKMFVSIYKLRKLYFVRDINK
jgi:dolichyl-phosphate beta-glucosyltransferase